MPDLEKSVNAAVEEWTGENRNKLNSILNSFGFFYKCMRISDYNTVGLVGGDNDLGGRWASLIKTIGGSDGEAGRGGSFGIGKSAPMAASEFRTVIYSTLTHEREYAFQGVCRLASHRDSDGNLTRSHGFIGEEGFKAVREKSMFPEFLKRSEVGTDIIVVGYLNQTAHGEIPDKSRPL